MSARWASPWSLLRQIGLILAVGLGLLATTLLSGLAVRETPASSAGTPPRSHGGVSLLLNVGVFWLGFRLAVQPEIKAGRCCRARCCPRSSADAQLLGTYLVSHQVSKSSSVYGVSRVSSACWPGSSCRPSSPCTRGANVVGVLSAVPRSRSPAPAHRGGPPGLHDVRADPGAPPGAGGGEPDHGGAGR